MFFSLPPRVSGSIASATLRLSSCRSDPPFNNMSTMMAESLPMRKPCSFRSLRRFLFPIPTTLLFSSTEDETVLQTLSHRQPQLQCKKTCSSEGVVQLFIEEVEWRGDETGEQFHQTCSGLRLQQPTRIGYCNLPPGPCDVAFGPIFGQTSPQEPNAHWVLSARFVRSSVPRSGSRLAHCNLPCGGLPVRKPLAFRVALPSLVSSRTTRQVPTSRRSVLLNHRDHLVRPGRPKGVRLDEKRCIG